MQACSKLSRTYAVIIVLSNTGVTLLFTSFVLISICFDVIVFGHDTVRFLF